MVHTGEEALHVNEADDEDFLGAAEFVHDEEKILRERNRGGLGPVEGGGQNYVTSLNTAILLRTPCFAFFRQKLSRMCPKSFMMLLC